MPNILEYIKTHKAELAYRGYHLAVGGGVIYDLVMNPSANIGEYAVDIGLHAAEFAFPNHLSEIMLPFNLLRGAQAGFACALGKTLIVDIKPTFLWGTSPWPFSFSIKPTSIPKIANGLDVLNHGMSAIRRLSQLMQSKPDQSAAQKKGKALTHQYQRQQKKVHFETSVGEEPTEKIKLKNH